MGSGEGLNIIALHGGGATCTQLLPLCRELNGVTGIFVPEGPLPSAGRFGTLGPARDWYVETEEGTIEPLGFAESLQQVEQFVFDTVDDTGTDANTNSGLWLLGLGQGGVFSLTLSMFWPELFKGVISVHGLLPEIPGWEPPHSEMKGLPILLIRDPEDRDSPEDGISASSSRLTSLGAAVTVLDVSGARLLTPGLTQSISAWLHKMATGHGRPATFAG
jgi:predicted esterase